MPSSELLPTVGTPPAPPEGSPPEIEFALVLFRMIDSVQQNPKDLRQAIYDLARHKLQEQLADLSEQEVVQTRHSLEVAIRGVEAFSAKNAEEITRTPPLPVLEASHAGIEQRLLKVRNAANPAFASAGSRKANLSYAGRAASVLALLFAVALIFSQMQRIRGFWPGATQRPTLSRAETPIATFNPPIQPVIAATEPALAPTKLDQTIPRSYGVYAIADGQLVELQLLPGRVPDPRVAISSVIQNKPQSVLPNGSPKFIIFRRDAASMAADRPEVRIISRIARDFSGNGKTAGEASEAWVMRNILFPFRAAPIEGRPEMYEVLNSDNAAELSPGRYALVLKGQAYDFSVAGKPSDPRQCLERVSAGNGTFYSECSKP